MLTSRLRHGLIAALLTVSLSACGEEGSQVVGEGPATSAASRSPEADLASGDPSSAPVASPGVTPGSTTAGPRPTEIPRYFGEVLVQGDAIVRHADGRMELCANRPPRARPSRCEGVPLVGWTEDDGPHERADGKPWIYWVLLGAWDGRALRVTQKMAYTPESPNMYQGTPDPDPPYQTACERPEGGWVVDPTKGDERMYDAINAAERLEDHAESWTSSSADYQNIINVRVHDDVARAEREIRRVWGGGLCVVRSQYSEKELTDLATELEQLPGYLSTFTQAEVVRVEVVFDDGSLQRWVDATYGEGRVRVRSWLEPR